MAEQAKNCAPGKEFVFKLPNGTVVGKAKNLTEFGELLKNAPLEAVLFHAKGKHFGPWLVMMGYDRIAGRMAALGIDEKTVRQALLKCLY